MTYEAFVELVERLWEEVPEDFKRGLQGVHVFPGVAVKCVEI